MSNNIPVTPGTGAVIAADDIGGVLHQKVKLVLGNDGTSDGDVSATNPMPVAIVSGEMTTITANIGTPGSLALDSTLTGGSQKSILHGAAKGTTSAADVTSTNIDSNTQALDVSIKGTSNVAVSNFPSSQTITGTVTVQQATGTNLHATVDNFPATQAVSAAALPLPSGAATSAAQTTGNNSLSSIDGKTPALGQALAAGSTPVVLPAAQITALTPPTSISVSNFPASQTIAGSISVSNFPASQPVTGTFFQTTQPVSAEALPLPIGAATSALQTSGNSSLSAIQTSTANIPAQGQALAAASMPVVLPAVQITALTPPTTVTVQQSTGANLHVDVDALPSLPAGSNSIGSVTVSNFPVTQPISAAALPLPTGASTESTLSSLNTKVTTTVNGIKVDGSATTQPVSGTFFQAIQPISATSLPLPAGAATDATLSSMSAKLPALGQTTMSGSQPVVIASNQSAIPVTGTFYPATQPISGSVSVSNLPATQPISAASLPLPTGAATETTLAALNTKVTTTANGLKVDNSAVTQPVSIATMPTTPVTGTFWQATQPVSGSVSVSNFPATQPVSIAASVPVTGTFFQTTQPVSAATLPLPSGAATAANQTTEIASLATIAGAVGTVSTPAAGIITIQGASSSISVPVSLSSTPLPAGAATSALQTTGNSSLSTIAANTANITVSQGSSTAGQTGQLTQAAVTNSAPTYVTGQTSPLSLTTAGALRTDSSATTQPVSAASLPLPSGAATSALQTTISNKLPSTLGAQTTSNSMAVNIASDQVVNVLQASLIKGTQGLNGITTQDLKDAGRNMINWYMANQVQGTNTDVLMSLTGYKSGAAVGATATPPVVTTGKIYRINMIICTYIATTTAGTVHFTLRANSGGTVTLASPAVFEYAIGGQNTTAGTSQTVSIPIPDGMEFPAGTGIGVSMQGFNTTGAAANNVGYGMIAIKGFEY